MQHIFRGMEVLKMKKRFRGIGWMIALGAVFLCAALPAYASAESLDPAATLRTVRGDIDSLLTPELLNSLNLTHNQRNSLEELRRRDWDDRGENRRDDRRYDNRFDRWDGRDFGRLFGLFDLGRRGYGTDVRIERGDDDNFRTFLALVALGLYFSQSQDGYGDDDYYRMMRLDDFLYLFLRILDENQRETFIIRFDRWYDDRYINRRYDWRDERYRWFPKDWDRRLRLDDRQRRDMERVFRDLDDRYRDRERRYREMEKNYFRHSWEDRSGRDREEQRRRLFEYRQQLRVPENEIRERLRPILNESQRRFFDSQPHILSPGMNRPPVKNDK